MTMTLNSLKAAVLEVTDSFLIDARTVTGLHLDGHGTVVIDVLSQGIHKVPESLPDLYIYIPQHNDELACGKYKCHPFLSFRSNLLI